MTGNWWKEAVIYQIYPQSFYDSNGDGIGDLPGIIQKLDYVKSLGVDVIWLNPIYDSPLDDNGYDIRDYFSIHPQYGTMDDFDRLLEEAHRRGLRIIMDLVVNHTSDEHKWFVKSRESRDNAYRDYYFWKPAGPDGGPPNDWKSLFSGSAWELDEQTGEYYLHYFTRKQPDLNWENREVRESVEQIINWWLEKGIDGFRLDVISMISKHLDFPDMGDMPFSRGFIKYYCNGPRVHEFIHAVYENCFKHYDIMTVGEGPGITTEHGNDYTGRDRGELDMVFPLDLMFADWGPKGKFDPGELKPTAVKDFFIAWDSALGDDGWMSVFLDNHDFARMVSRFGNDTTFRDKSAKLLVTMLMTLRGTPSILYGSEIGMTNVHFDTIDDYRDVESLNFYREAVGEGMPPEVALDRIRPAGRDNVRTPMQWNDSVNGGFSTGDPWLHCNPNYTVINVEAEEKAREGILGYYRKMIVFRKENPTLIYGAFENLDTVDAALFAYTRTLDQNEFLVILNMGDNAVTFSHNLMNAILRMSNYDMPDDHKLIRPWEARIYSR